jgi:hypothetical protein
MAAPDVADRDIVGLDARAVRASVRVVSRAGAAGLARPTPRGLARLAGATANVTVEA